MGDSPIKSIISYLIVVSVFVTGTSGGEAGITFYWYYPVYILFILLVLILHPKLNGRIMAFLGLAILYALVTFKTGFNLVVKQIINITFNAIVFYFFIWFENFDMEKIFIKIIRVAKIVIVLGFIQVILFTINKGQLFIAVFPFLQSYPMTARLQSITQEPSYVAFVFTPIIFVSINNLFYRQRLFFSRTWSVIFIIGFLLTLSSIAYLSFLLAIVLVYLKNLTYAKLVGAAFVLVIVGAMAFAGYKYINDVKIRVDDTVLGLEKFSQGNVYKDLNTSTFALLSNMYVTGKEFVEDPITGHGLGTHELVYDKFIPQKMTDYIAFGLNRRDANSMALRLISETGLVGFGLFIFFMIRFKVRSRKSFDTTEQKMWLINAGIFILIFLALLRNGNYTVHGKILFFMMYYFSYVIVKKRIYSETEPEAPLTSPQVT